MTTTITIETTEHMPACEIGCALNSRARMQLDHFAGAFYGRHDLDRADLQERGRATVLAANDLLLAAGRIGVDDPDLKARVVQYLDHLGAASCRARAEQDRIDHEAELALGDDDPEAF